MSIIEAYPEDLQQAHPIRKQQPVKFQQVHPGEIQTPKLKTGTTIQYTPQVQKHVISEQEKLLTLGPKWISPAHTGITPAQ